MTSEEIRSMTPGPEMDAAVAQHIMGWPLTDDDPDPGDEECIAPCVTNWFVAIDGHPRAYNHSPERWRPSTDPAAAHDVEDEIERRGLALEYTVELIHEVGRKPRWWETGWALIRATPEQKCRAALAAVGTKEASCKPAK